MSGDPWAAFDVGEPKAAAPDEWAAFDPPKPARSAPGRWRVTPGEAEARWEPSAPAVPPQQKPMVPNSIGRTLALGTRDVLEGVAQVPGMALDALALPGNLAAHAYNSMTPGSYRIGYTQPASQTFGKALDVLGMPTAQTDGERLASAITKGAASTLTGAGAANVAARTLAGTPQAVARVLASQPATQVASGAVGGGVGEATDSPVAGMIAGALTPVAVAGARRIITPIANVNSPGRQALIDAAKREGIPLTAGQATGSPFLQNVEAVLEQMPFTSGPQRAIGDNQRAKFIEAAWRKAGETASDTLPETIKAARDRIGGTIGAIADRNNMIFTPQLDAELAEISKNLRFMPPEVAGPVGARIDQLRGMAIGKFPNANVAPPPSQTGVAGNFPQLANNSRNVPAVIGGANVPAVLGEVSASVGAAGASQVQQMPFIPGPSYRMLDSQIGQSIRQSSDGDRRAALTAIREKMRAAMDASISPNDKTSWDTARRQYANMSVIADAAGQAGASAAEGVMSPVALRGALAKSIGKGGYELGRGDMNDLARIGQSLLRAPADSRTAGRTFAQNILTGSLGLGGAGMGAAAGGPIGAMVGAAGAVAIPRVAQMMMNSGPGQAYLRNQLAVDPILTKNLARALALHGAIQANNPTGP